MLLKALLDHSLLWIACLHHVKCIYVLEVILANVFKCIFGSSTGPQIQLLKRLMDN